jgi:hypothetical protein
MSNELLNPRGLFQFDKNPIAPRLDGMDGKIIGLIDNCKNNADVLLDAVYELISQSNTVPKVLRIQKQKTATPAILTPEFLDMCDYVINAVGD